MLSSIGTTEILVVSLVLIVLFGGKRIPEFVRSLGDSVSEFRRRQTDFQIPHATPLRIVQVIASSIQRTIGSIK